MLEVSRKKNSIYGMGRVTCGNESVVWAVNVNIRLCKYETVQFIERKGLLYCFQILSFEL